MSLHPIDELFKKRFANREEKTPEHLWSGIEDALHGKRRTRPLAPLWLKWSALGAFLLIGVSIVSYQIDWGQDASKTILSKDFQDKGSSTSPSITVEGNKEETSISKVESAEQKQKVGPKGKGAQNAVSNDQENVEDQYKAQRTNNNDIYAVKNTSRADAKNAGVSERNTSVQENTPSSGLPKEINSDSDILGGYVFAAEEKKTRVASESIKRERLTILEGLQSGRDNVTQKLLSEEENTYRIIDKVNTQIGYGRRSLRFKWFGQLGYAYDFVQRDMTPRTNSARAMTNYRNSHETLANAFTVSLELGVRWHQWSVITGLHYAQINDRYDYVLEDVTKDVNGTPVSGKVSRSVVNRYRSIEVPIMVQYEWRREQWSFGAIAGISFGVDYEMTGQLLNNETLDIIDFDSQNSGPYVQRIAYQPIVAFQVGYMLGYRSMLFLRPMYKYNPNSLTIDGYEVDHGQSVLSGLMGIRYNIN